MHWANWCEVRDLMAATGAGSNDFSSGGLLTQLLHEGLGDFQGKFVFRFERAKGSGHSATAGFQHRDRPPRQALCETGHVLRVRERFRMAMGVNCDVSGTIGEGKRGAIPLQQIVDELLEEEAAACALFGLGNFQLPIILSEHRVA